LIRPGMIYNNDCCESRAVCFIGHRLIAIPMEMVCCSLEYVRAVRTVVTARVGLTRTRG